MRISKYSIYEVLLFHIYLLVFYFTFPQKDEWMPTIVLLLLIGVLMILEYLRNHILVSPLLVWYFFWLGAISFGRMDLNLYPFYQTWSRKLLLVILLNTALFFWMFWVGEGLTGKTFAAKAIQTKYSAKLRGERLALLTVGMLAAGSAAFMLNVFMAGYIPLFTDDVNLFRQRFVLLPFYRLVNILRFTFAIVPLAIRETKQRAMKTVLAFFTVVFMFCEMLSGWRSYTMQAIVLLLSSILIIRGSPEQTYVSEYCQKMYLLRKEKAQRKTLPIVIAFSLFALAFIGYIAVNRDGVIGAFREKLEYLFYTIDMYIAPNFLNFQSGMENIEPLGYPLYTTEAFWGLVTSWEQLPPYPPIDQSIGAFNVSTYLLQPFVDLGIPGTAIWSTIAGIAAGAVFKRCRTDQSTVSLVLIGIINFAILVMHNNFFFRASSTVIWIAGAFCLDTVIRTSENQSKGSIQFERRGSIQKKEYSL